MKSNMRVVDKDLPDHFDELDVLALESYEQLDKRRIAIDLVIMYKVTDEIIDKILESGADVDFSEVVNKYMLD